MRCSQQFCCASKARGQRAAWTCLLSCAALLPSRCSQCRLASPTIHHCCPRPEANSDVFAVQYNARLILPSLLNPPTALLPAPRTSPLLPWPAPRISLPVPGLPPDLPAHPWPATLTSLPVPGLQALLASCAPRAWSWG